MDPSRGDPEAALTALFDAYAGDLRRYLARRVGAVAADDLVADTFLAALTSRLNYDRERATPRGWLYGIATNLLRNHYRSESRLLAAEQRSHYRPAEPADRLDDRVADRVDAQRWAAGLAGAISGLTAGDRDVLLLSAWAGLDGPEIAAALQIPVGTVRSRLHRVRRQLRSPNPLFVTGQDLETDDV